MKHKIFTEVISDVIGDDPIFDQFDLISPNSFYGSTQDDYVDGNLLSIDQISTARNNKLVFTAGSREKLFSKLDASTTAPLDSTYGSQAVVKNSSYAERLVPWTEKVSNSYRITQCIDDKERIYDTCLPDIQECFAADGVSFWQTHDDPKYWLSPYGNVETQDIGYILFNAGPITNQKKLSNDSWTWSFPFSSRYKDVNRVIYSEDVLRKLNFSITTNWYPKSFVQLKEKNFGEISTSTFLPLFPGKLETTSFLPLLPGKPQVNETDTTFKIDATLPDNSIGSYRILIPSDVNLNKQNPASSQLVTSSMSNTDMIKFLFGFGDLNNITYVKYSLNNEDEDEDEDKCSQSYFTGFEAQNWTKDLEIPNPSGPGTIVVTLSFASSTLDGSTIPMSGTSPTYFNAQFDQTTTPVIVQWVAPSASIGTNDGYPAIISEFDPNFDNSTVRNMGIAESGVTPREYAWKEYPWILEARDGVDEGIIFDPNLSDLIKLNYLHKSTYSYYSDNKLKVLEAPTAVYWRSGSNPSRHWVLGSFLSSSKDARNHTYKYEMPYPAVPGGKIVSTQKVNITASYPWKISYERAISAPTTDYFYSSFSGMPGFDANTSTIDYVIDKLNGTDVVFNETQEFEQTPQLLTAFTSSLFPPGQYQMKFSYVKQALTGTSNGVNRAFIDDVSICTYDIGQLTGSFKASNRIGYSHYPKFRQIIRDTRTSPYFPGDGFKTRTSIYKSLSKNTDRTIRQLQPTITQQTLLELAKTVTELPIPDPLEESLSYLESNDYGGYEFGISPIIRGWKYGLYSGLPVHTYAVFRRNRYGQFRDMLEQRLFTKAIFTDKSSITNVVRGTKTSNEKDLNAKKPEPLREGPVSVEFVTQEAKVDSNGLGVIVTKPIEPSLTNSQNLSIEYTSEEPFTDQDPKERSNNFINIGGRLIVPEMVLTTATAAEFNSSSPAVTRVLPPNNLTITTRGTPTRS